MFVRKESKTRNRGEERGTDKRLVQSRVRVLIRRWESLLMTAMILGAGCTSGEGVARLPIDMSGGMPLAEKYSPKTEVYEDPTIRVELHRVDGNDTEWKVYYYYALISLQDASQLRTAAADGKSFVSRAKAPAQTIARRVNAALAINGDYSGTDFGGKGDTFILRQGTLFRDDTSSELDLLLIDEDGDFHVLSRNEENRNIDKTEIDGKKVINAFQFGPALVIDGQKVPDGELIDKSHSPLHAEPEGRAQRMCIAQIGPLQYMVLCCRWGLSLTSLRDLAMSLADCRTVYTLDGGNSTQLIFLGQKINNVKSDGDNVRPITDIIYFASANGAGQ